MVCRGGKLCASVAHRLPRFWQYGFGSLVLELWFLKLECVCVFGFEVGVGFGERVIDL